jgi:OmpA-OmpF porin, OOP family
MFRCRSFAPRATLLVALAVVLLVAGVAIDARASFPKLPKLKEKAAEVKDAAKSVLPDRKEGDKPAQKGQGDDAAAGDEAKPAAPAAGGASEDMALYTKYDFVPGDKVILYDDLAKEEAGEFPSRWGLVKGVFEVARLGTTNWILATDEGTIFPKLAPGLLPPKFTVEMDFYDHGEKFSGSHFHLKLTQGKQDALELQIYDSSITILRTPKGDLASKQLPERLGKGVHTMRIMATPTTLKCYIDHERVANVPSIEGFAPDGIEVYCQPDGAKGNSMLFGNLRFAAGGKTMREQLEQDGRIVTHGILFDSGSAVIKAESYKTLALIGDMLAGDTALRLSIEGHTDSDGADDANLKLSQQRADAVKTYLVSNSQVGADRLQTNGLGETKPIDVNTTPEGKANNRRVELVKL